MNRDAPSSFIHAGSISSCVEQFIDFTVYLIIHPYQLPSVCHCIATDLGGTAGLQLVCGDTPVIDIDIMDVFLFV